MEQQSNIDIAKIAYQLGSWQAKRRVQAEQMIKQVGVKAIEPLLIMLEQESKKRIWRVFISILMISFILQFLASELFERTSFPATLRSGIIGGISALISLQLYVSILQKNVVIMLARFNDLRVVGPLIEALEYPSKSVRRIATGALIHLLPHIQTSDGLLLTDTQQKCLYRALKGKNSDLLLAILKALEQIGDSQALSYVEELAKGRGKSAKDAQVREAAQACLPFLRERTEGQRAEQTLLRAADGSVTATDTLLRPAQGVSDADPQVLLRPGTPDGET